MIKLILSHILFHMGDISCKILHLKCFRYADENNEPLQWLADFYQWCMKVSLDLDVGKKVWKLPKLDGSNSSVWLDGDDIKYGSRNRELTLDNDNAGFYKSILDDYDNIHQYLYKHPTHRLFGEWLIPHTLKTYDKDAWRKFYVFDVMIEDEYINYDIYKEWLEEYDIEYILKVIGK